MRRYCVLAALAALMAASWAALAALPAAAGAVAAGAVAATSPATSPAAGTCASAGVCDAAVESVSCPSARACAASGVYADGDGKSQAFVISERGGRWSRAEEVPGTAALNTGRDASADAVSCPSAGNCTVSGAYKDSSRHAQVYAAAEINGKWGRARELPGSAALHATSAEALLACPSPGNCVTGGIYDVPRYTQESYLASEAHGRWGPARRIRGSRAFNSSQLTYLMDLSCASAGNCSAGGSYAPAGGLDDNAFVISERHGRWGRPVEVAAALDAGHSAQVNAVSCPAAGDCTATGYYADRHDRGQAFVVSQHDFRWGAARPVPGLQALNVGGDAQPNAVACASAGNCSVGGSYSQGYPPNQVEHVQAFVASEKNGHWGAAEEVPGSAALNQGLDAEVMGMSCPAAGDCAATVTYLTNGYQAGVVTQVRGTWTRIRKTRGWAGIRSQGNNQIASISCASPGDCVAGGTFESAVGEQAFLVSERGGVWGDVWQVRGF